jgi:hypothetical protein
MKLPRVRFTVRDMMIVVALTPIVSLSGWVTRDFWPISSSFTEVGPASSSPDGISWTLVAVERFSILPSLLSMAATAAALGACWAIVARRRRDPTR